MALRRARGALGLGAPGGCSTKPVACHTSRAAWSRARVVKPRRISGGTAGGTGKLKSPKVFSSQKGLGKKKSPICSMLDDVGKEEWVPFSILSDGNNSSHLHFRHHGDCGGEAPMQMLSFKTGKQSTCHTKLRC